MAGVKDTACTLLSALLKDIQDGKVRVFSAHVSDDGQTEQLQIVYARLVDPRYPHRPCSCKSTPLDTSDGDSGEGRSYTCPDCGSNWEEPKI